MDPETLDKQGLKEVIAVRDAKACDYCMPQTATQDGDKRWALVNATRGCVTCIWQLVKAVKSAQLG